MESQICIRPQSPPMEDHISTNFGVKEIHQDEKGQWYLNNKHIFLRGMRYISSLWMSEANEDMWNAGFCQNA